MFGYNLSRRAPVDYDAPLRLFCCESLISLAQLFVKLRRFSLEPVCGIVSTTALCARQTCLSGDIHDERQLRECRADCYPFEAADQAFIDVTQNALIHPR